jgi:SH3-like domain-containing protein
MRTNSRMTTWRFFPFLILALLAAPALAADHGSGLPIPRFVTLKSDETNARTGPGTRYPIQWVYRKAGMPVEVIEEYDLWRKIRDADGGAGWVHKTMILGTRNVMITGKPPRVLRIDADLKTKPLLKVEPQVIARLVECQKDWCRIQVSGRKGWIEKKYLWGVYPEEIIE